MSESNSTSSNVRFQINEIGNQDTDKHASIIEQLKNKSREGKCYILTCKFDNVNEARQFINDQKYGKFF